MPIEFNALEKRQFNQVYQCFVEAFADYHLDMSYMNGDSYFNRMIKNGIDFNCSVGAFDRGKMVGFTLVGIDCWKGHNAAFDTSTGIILKYRGKRIAAQMFDFIIPRLKEKGIKKFVLEVLKVNQAAIKAYQRSGFKVSREFDCYQLDLKDLKPIDFQNTELAIHKIERDDINGFSQHIDWYPSWENSFSSIARIPDELNIYGAFLGNDCLGILVYYPSLKWILNLMVKKEFRRRGVASQLLANFISEIPSEVSSIKMVNIEVSKAGSEMANFLERRGFKIYTSQYEMEFNINE